MKKIKNILHRAQSIELRAWGRELRARPVGGGLLFLCVFASLRELEENNKRQKTKNKLRETANHEQQATKNPLQVILNGSKYSSVSCLPREGVFNSDVCPEAAAITRNYSTNSSLQIMLSGEGAYPKFLTSPGKGCIYSKLPRHEVWEGLPM